MGKKRGYNWKGRQVVNTIIDDSQTKKIKLDIDVDGKYDSSNALVLPSKKRKTKIKESKKQDTKILSRKHRKLLEKVVEKKQKKEKRTDLLEALSKVQATPEDLKRFTPFSTIQTMGLKQYFYEQEHGFKVKKFENPDRAPPQAKLSSIKGSKRKLILPEVKTIKDLNVVGFDSSGSDVSSDDSDDVDVVKAQNTGGEITSSDSTTPSVTITAEKQDEHSKLSDSMKSTDTNQVKLETEVNRSVEMERKRAVFVEVFRNPKLERGRSKLPILGVEQEIMEAINEYPVVLIAGETGSGKTTQIPQFLYQAGYAIDHMIGITEPRRVAAVSMSKRVADEMCLTHKQVSYLIRFEGNVTDETKIKFMTDGVLLREIENDFLLRKYSVIVLDEAHERSVHTDVLIGFLTRIVPLRLKKGIPLKLVIMSATLKLDDFTENDKLFVRVPKPPVINVQGRQFPVTIHFNRYTHDDYVKMAFKKVVKIHSTLPKGGILVFVTGQQEVNQLVRKLQRKFPMKNMNNAQHKKRETLHNDDGDDSEEAALGKVMKKRKRKKKTIVLPRINLDDYDVPGENEAPLSDQEDSSFEDSEGEELDLPETSEPLWVLPLYSLLSTVQQSRVFESPPEGCRLCVISTNVAETSVTIPGVKYVVDTGKTKVQLFDKMTGASKFVVTWTSKASANQRAGRAGRVEPGHCYRLYSSAIFEHDFPNHSEPEIRRRPVDDVYLQLKCMNISKVINFPFPTAPDIEQLLGAEHRLHILDIVDDKGKVTDLGHLAAKYPVSPRFGKLLVLSRQHGLMPYSICLVAALSVQELLLETPVQKMIENSENVETVRQKWWRIRKDWAGVGNKLLLGDAMVLLCAVGGAEFANHRGKLKKFCEDNGVREKAIVEVRKLRLQLTNEILTNVPDLQVVVDPEMKPPTEFQMKLLRQAILSTFGDHVAKKIAPSEIENLSQADRSKLKYAYWADTMVEPVFLHRASVLKDVQPTYVIYQELYEVKGRTYMRGVTAIEVDWLPMFVPALCALKDPPKENVPKYDPESGKVKCCVTGTFGARCWSLPDVEIDHPENNDAYMWFVVFLLQGDIFAKFKMYKSKLLQVPNSVFKFWARRKSNIIGIVQVLLRRKCRSRRQLEGLWDEEPNFLLKEYLQWLPENLHAEVSSWWPPVEEE